MTKKELLEIITTEVNKVIEHDDDLSGDDLSSVEDCVGEVIDNAEEAIDEAADEEDA